MGRQQQSRLHAQQWAVVQRCMLTQQLGGPASPGVGDSAGETQQHMRAAESVTLPEAPSGCSPDTTLEPLPVHRSPLQPGLPSLKHINSVAAAVGSSHAACDAIAALAAPAAAAAEQPAEGAAPGHAVPADSSRAAVPGGGRASSAGRAAAKPVAGVLRKPCGPAWADETDSDEDVDPDHMRKLNAEIAALNEAKRLHQIVMAALPHDRR